MRITFSASASSKGTMRRNGFQAFHLLGQLLNAHKLLNDRFKLVLLCGRKDESNELMEANALIFTFEHVFGIQCELKNAASGVAPLILPLLDLLCDLLEFLFHCPKIALKLFEQ